MNVLTFCRQHCIQRTMGPTVGTAAFLPSRQAQHACTLSTRTSVHAARPARYLSRQRPLFLTKTSSQESSASLSLPRSLGNKANLPTIIQSTMGPTSPHAAAERSRSMLRELSSELAATTASLQFTTHEACISSPWLRSKARTLLTRKRLTGSNGRQAAQHCTESSSRQTQ
jgi:hypothetical protein